MLTNSTHFFYDQKQQKKWYIIDATGLCLGRLAVEVAKILKGKKKATFTPNNDSGDYVIVTNCEKVALTSNKSYTKVLYKHTGYAGGIKEARIKDVLNGKNPARVVKHAVEGMFPHHSKLAYEQLTKLFIYKGDNHPHVAQNPIKLDIASFNRKNAVSNDNN
jgi:large subunit ribosomal protein L13